MDCLKDNLEKAEHVAEIVKALGHPVRLRILAILNESNSNVTSLAKRLGVPQSSVSMHLKILCVHGILTRTREGLSVRYTLARPCLKDLLVYFEEYLD